jgi:hypothetical protein
LWAVDLIATPSSEVTGTLDFRNLTTVWRALIDPGGHVHIVLQDGDVALTVHAKGQLLLSRPVSISVLVEGTQGLLHAPNVLHRFRDLISPLTATTKSNVSSVRDYGRLRDALIGLDSDLAGMTYRSIAAALFGEGTAAEDWGGGQSSLKQRVRRTVKRGHDLSNGGYRRLLQI